MSLTSSYVHKYTTFTLREQEKNMNKLKQIDLISNTEYLNRQYSIEYLLEQLNNIYQEELEFQQELNNN